MTTWVRPRRPDRLAMIFGAAAMLVAAPLWAQTNRPTPDTGAGYDNPAPTSASSASQTPSANKDELVHTLVQLTDVAQLRDVFSQQFIDRVSSAMEMFGGTLDARTMTAVRQQTRAVVSERITDGDALYSVLAPIYEKHFNLIELNQLVTFYQSPLGQKLVRISPELLTESLDLGQQWGLSLVPEIVSRVRAQLNGDTPPPVDDDTGAAY